MNGLSMLTYISLSACVLWHLSTAQMNFSPYYGTERIITQSASDDGDSWQNDQYYVNQALREAPFSVSRRGAPLLPVVFFCSKKTAVCMNGGRGPTVKWDKAKARPLCVCNCPVGYTAPKCGRKLKKNGK